MPSPSVLNSLSTSDLNVVELTDPNRIQFYADSIGEQINSFRMKYAPQKRVLDLSQWIADIIIETSAQGSSLLEVHIIDPAWTLFVRDKNGVSFIDVDDSGFLWPPVEVTFPSDISDSTWRLCQCKPSTDLTQANVILTFEDKIVSELREQAQAQNSYPNQTRAEFIQSLVKQTNDSPAYIGEVKIRFVALLPHSTFTTADLTMQQQVPKSATQKNPPPARKNPNKTPASSAAPGKTAPFTGTNPFLNPFAPIAKPTTPVGQAVSGVEISIQAGWDAMVGGLTNNPYTQTTPPPTVLQTLGGT